MTSPARIPRAMQLTLQRGMFSVYAFALAALLGTFLLYFTDGQAHRRWSSVLFDLSCSALLALFHALPVWAFVMLPLSLILRIDSSLHSAVIAPLFGALCGAATAAVELATWSAMLSAMLREDTPIHDPSRFCFYGAAVGACAWSVFSWMLRRCGRALPCDPS